MIFYDYFVAGFIDIPFTFSAWLGLIISRSVLYPKNLLEQKSLWLEHEWISPADGWRTKRDFYRPVLTLLSVMWPNKSIMIRFRPCISCLREYNARYLFLCIPVFLSFSIPISVIDFYEENLLDIFLFLSIKKQGGEADAEFLCPVPMLENFYSRCTLVF